MAVIMSKLGRIWIDFRGPYGSWMLGPDPSKLQPDPQPWSRNCLKEFFNSNSIGGGVKLTMRRKI